MAILSEKVRWVAFAIFIFAIMAGLYIDDRSRIAEEKSGMIDKKRVVAVARTVSVQNMRTPASRPVRNKTNKGLDEKSTNARHTSDKSFSMHSSGSPTSLHIDEYLAQTNRKRSAELIANVIPHQGFHGELHEYLENISTSKQDHGATSMSLIEYLATPANRTADKSTAYHGDIEGYLARFGDSQSNPN